MHPKGPFGASPITRGLSGNMLKYGLRCLSGWISVMIFVTTDYTGVMDSSLSADSDPTTSSRQPLDL